ncbi:MAG: pyrroloquinoline quinone biosynthesis peptide chaperone PqqD [Streptomycetaceae bacterium]|nr:pyrroloquinoline quinone biosynthesis peptide chaperone PqqD [Streptomycetaceae bacterium]
MPSIKPIRTEKRVRTEKRAVGERGSTAMTSSSRPKLASHMRMRFDPVRQQHVLLGPESVVVLNQTGADILAVCDGRRTVADIVAALRGRYDRVIDEDVRLFLARLAAKRCVEICVEIDDE